MLKIPVIWMVLLIYAVDFMNQKKHQISVLKKGLLLK